MKFYFETTQQITVPKKIEKDIMKGIKTGIVLNVDHVFDICDDLIKDKPSSDVIQVLTSKSVIKVIKKNSIIYMKLTK